jgi:glycosyltransferase involved in cell wall biosynthesis
MSKKILLISISSVFHDGRINTYIQKLTDMGYKVLVISLKQDKKEKMIERNRFTNYKIVKRYIGSSAIGYVWFYSKFFIINFFLTAYLTFKYRLKIIHYNNSPNFLIFSCFISKLLGTKIILDNHDLVPATVLSKFGKGLLHSLAESEQKLSVKFADRIICADHNQSDYLNTISRLKNKVIPILNVPNKTILIYENNNRDTDIFSLVYHGTISYRLGIDLVIKSIDLIKSELKNFKFHLIGKGDFLSDINNLVNDLSLEEYVTIYNKYVPYLELPDVLKNMNAGIIGNRQEILSDYMLPVKLLEYVNFKIPVIAPRNKIITRYFTEDMLCFYEPENVEEMAEKILFLYNDKQARERFAANAFKFTEQYNYETEMKKYEAVIRQLQK